MSGLRIACAQINCVVGDLAGNSSRLLSAYEAAVASHCDLVVGPELSITGYPPEDLLLRRAFVNDAERTLVDLAVGIGSVPLVVGYPERVGTSLFNAAAVLRDGAVVANYRKQILPNYAVFDEQRYFAAGPQAHTIVDVAGMHVGISICEDAWHADGPIAQAARAGADFVVNLNASPYARGRVDDREVMLKSRALESRVPIVYCNLVGGQDELVFDGASMVVNAEGSIVARAPQFVEDVFVVDFADLVHAPTTPKLAPVHEVYEALVLGTRDYVRKTGFANVAIGLSGGIDSALVAAVAVDALGAENVHGVLMPSRYSSEGSITDAEALARNLGVATHTVPIEPAHAAFEGMLAHVFEGADSAPGVAEENVQARIRGNVMMTISNKFNWMVLTTGNKSEMATGYATLYGDMAGGYAVIKDVPKTLVFALCRDLNARMGREVIPQSTIDKPPSAELRPDQKDSDSLPDYSQLDPIIAGYVEDDQSVDELIAAGHNEADVRRVARLIDRNEYKRRQAAPGVRITRKAFGKDRRLPITNRWPG